MARIDCCLPARPPGKQPGQRTQNIGEQTQKTARQERHNPRGPEEEKIHSAPYFCPASSSGQNGRNINHCVGHSRITSSRASYIYCVRRAISRVRSSGVSQERGNIGGKART